MPSKFWHVTLIKRIFFRLRLWSFGIAALVLSNARESALAQAPPLLSVEDIDVTVPTHKGRSVDGDADQEWLPKIQFQPLPALLSPNGHNAATDQNLASPHVIFWLSRMLRANIPPVYEDTRKWGLQKEVWDGVDFERDGMRIKTHSKRKLVNDGTWSRYRVAAVDPDNRMTIKFHRLEVLASDGKVHFDVSIEMLLDVFGRMSQWVRDVQLISLSANADAVCRCNIKGTVGFQLNPLQFPPDITIKPKVEQANVDVIYFRVRRISQLGGPLAKQLGNGLKRVLDDKLEDTNAKLADRINVQLERKADRMSFSTQDWLQSKLPLPEGRQP